MIQDAEHGEQLQVLVVRDGAALRQCYPMVTSSLRLAITILRFFRARNFTTLASGSRIFGGLRLRIWDSPKASAFGSRVHVSKASRKLRAAIRRIHQVIIRSCSCAAWTTAR